MLDRAALLLPTPMPPGSPWSVRSYLVRHDPAEQVDVQELNVHLRLLMDEVHSQHCSSEFDYYRVGFLITHYGRRGVCVSLWHWGRWGISHEMFGQSWYTYGRNLRMLEFMDRSEPLFSQYEMPILLAEFRLFGSLSSIQNDEQAREHFVSLPLPEL